MTPEPLPNADALPAERCRRCGYDVTALAANANCPACGSSVAISRFARPAIESFYDASGRIDVDLPCIRCAAKLYGVAYDDRCPGCGVPVSRSTLAVASAVVRSNLACARCSERLTGLDIEEHCPRCGLRVRESIAAIGSKPPVDADGLIIGEVHCRKCAYDLRGLNRAGNCPECGAPVEASVYGDFLAYAEPAWVAGVARGATLTVWGIGLILAALLGGFLSALLMGLLGAFISYAAIAPGCIASVCLLVGAILLYVGAWVMAAPEPGRTESRSAVATGTFLRLSLVAGALAGPLMAVAEDFDLQGPLSGMLALFAMLLAALNAAGVVAYFELARRLWLRVPDDVMARRAAALRAGFGIGLGALVMLAVVAVAVEVTGGASEVIEITTTFGGVLAAVVLLICSVLGAMHQFRLRRALVEQSDRAARHWEWTLARSIAERPKRATE